MKLKLCTNCQEEIKPILNWHSNGSQFAYCLECENIFLVTSLSSYGPRDAIIKDGFLHIEKCNSKDFPLNIDDISSFEELMRLDKYQEARNYIQRIEVEAIRMLFECLFYELLPQIVPVEIEKLYLSESIKFLTLADPSTYIFHTSETPPLSSYSQSNPFEFVGPNNTLLVFSPNLGKKLILRNRDAVRDIMFSNNWLWDRLNEIEDMYKEGALEGYRRGAVRSLKR